MIFLFLVLAALAVGAGIYFLAKFLGGQRLRDSLKMVLLSIKIHKGIVEGTATKDFKQEINLTEQLLSGLASLKKPFVLELAVPHVGEEIQFYLSVPRLVREVAVKQIQGIWANASVEEADDDYNIFNPSGATAGAYLKQGENYALPIRTYQEIGMDTFSAIVGSFSKMNEIGEGAALQIVARPATKESKKRFESYLRSLKRGEPLKRVFGHDFPFGPEEMKEAFNPKGEEAKKAEKVVDEEAVKALTAKTSKPLFEVNVRLLSSAPTPFQANDILDGLTAGFTQFGSPLRNDFKVVKPRNSSKLVYDFSFRNFNNGQSMILNSEEIASFYHMPISSTETPRVKWLKSREAPPPSNLPDKGVLIGKSVFRGQSKDIYVTDDDRRRHIYVIGQTGTGKSTLLGNMIVDDIKKGKGVAIIDPHGDLAENALSYVPENRLNDVIYFDPGDIQRPLGLNMLEYDFNKPEEKTFIVNEMQGIFNKLFPPETMGPMFEQYMRNALLLLMEDMPNEPATLIEMPRIFTDSEYRKRKLARIQNPVVIDFWEKEAVKAGGEASLANMTPYITSKFNNFISNDYMRPIIGQPKSAFNFRQVMDEGKILLVNLSKGRIGDINAGLLGMVFTGKLLMAALSRVDIAEADKRRDFNLYVDEFQNFTTDSISTILSEARKYRLNMTMAHQFIAQLTEKTRDSVFGNVGSQIIFRVGIQDAEFLEKQFQPVFDKNDLINIDNFNAYVKTLVNGETVKPFNIQTLLLERGNRELIDQLKESSRQKYGADRQETEEAIFKRLRM
ncbi:MAG: type IV secretion system DNA-binding domain-containing protein [Candidatus Liptonbacteria bacterium]|nr:type IV secretion system DNA-binding domain-containing protein [Candidatus Liptonbacteria bacterium]